MVKMIITLMLAGFVQAYGQGIKPKILFASGQQFEKMTTGESTTTMRRGNQVLAMKITSELTKHFTVKAVTDTGYSFDVSISRILNKMESLGNQMVYNSLHPVDSNGVATNFKNPLIEQTAIVFINKIGAVVKTDEHVVKVSNSDHKTKQAGGMRETLERFTANPQAAIPGASFELVPYFNLSRLVKNSRWVDTIETDDNRQVITYVTTDRTAALITISFSGDVLRTDASNDDDIREKSNVSGTLHGEIKIDPANGTFVSKTTDYEMKGVTEVMGIKLWTTVSNSITETVVKK